MLTSSIHTLLEEKKARLKSHLAALGSGLLLLSGGADSGFLAWVLEKALGDKALALTFRNPASTLEELNAAGLSASFAGLRHLVRDIPLMGHGGFVSNTPDRCYHCKRLMFHLARNVADEEGIPHVMDGTNATDTSGHRPGLRAAKELGVLSPLVETKFHRNEVRLLAQRAGLPSAGLPPGACLATRIPYGTPVTLELLDLVKRAESRVRDLGFFLVRVRVSGESARVEVGQNELFRLLKEPDSIRVQEALTGLGFKEVILDPEGYKGLL